MSDSYRPHPRVRAAAPLSLSGEGLDLLQRDSLTVDVSCIAAPLLTGRGARGRGGEVGQRRRSLPTLILLALTLLAFPSLSSAQSIIPRGATLGAARLLDGTAGFRGHQSIYVETLGAPGATSTEVLVRENDYDRVRARLPVTPGARRVSIVPVPNSYGNSLEVRYPGDEASASTVTGVETVSETGTTLALVGLASRVRADITSPPHSQLFAGELRTTASSGEPEWPRSWIEWGSVDAVVVSSSAWVRAPEEARRAVEDLVLAGATLVVSPRNPADLREQTLARMAGPVELAATDASGASRITGPRLARLPFGVACEYGLGNVVFFDRDLAEPRVVERPENRDLVAQLGAYLVGRGGAIWSPSGPTGASNVSEDSGSVRAAMHTRAHLRGLIAVASALLFLYVIATVVIVSRERAKGTPLRAFVRVPALGVVLLLVLVALGSLIRGTKSTARALVFVEAGSGASRGVRHVLGELTAGHTMSFDLVPRPGEISGVSSGVRRVTGTPRWDGSRLGTEGVRLSTWETVGYYTEGLVELGAEGVTVRFAPDGASVTVRNGTPWTLRSFSVRGPQGASFWRGTAPLAPGAEVRLSESVAESLVEADPTEPVDVSHSRRARSLFASRAGFAPEVLALIDRVVPDGSFSSTGLYERAELWAVAERPAGMAPAPASQFELAPGSLVLRIVVPVPVEAGATAPEPAVRPVVSSWGSGRAGTPSGFVRWTPRDPLGWRNSTGNDSDPRGDHSPDAGPDADATSPEDSHTDSTTLSNADARREAAQ